MPAKRSNPKTMHRAGELRKELRLAIVLDDESAYGAGAK